MSTWSTQAFGWRRFFRVIAVLMALSLLAAACGDDDDSGASSETTAGDGSSDGDGGADEPTDPGEPQSGGTLIYGNSNEVASYLPQDLRQTTSGEDRGAFIYDTLLKLDEAGVWEPHMADMESDDAITWTMTLEEGINFHDGTPLDAEAVKFNIELTQDPELGSPLLSTVADVQEMNVIDDTTLEIVLGGPDGSFPYAFTSLPGMMVSPTAYEADPEGFGSNPVGAGPYVFESWLRESNTVLVKNEDYWQEGKPYLDGVEFRILFEPLTRAQSLIAGDINLAENEADVQANVQDEEGIVVVNENPSGAQAVVPNHDRPPFDDVRIREAIALAFEPSVANASIMQGAWTSEDFNCPPFTPQDARCLQDVWPEPDPERAMALVDEYEAENGELEGPFSLLGHPGVQPDNEYVQQELSEIGIDVELNLLPIPEMVAGYSEGSYDMAWSAIVPFTGPATSFYRNLFGQEAGGRHMQGGPVDAELEELMSQATKAPDDAERLEAAQEVQRINATEFLYIWFAPFPRGLVKSAEVMLPPSYSVGAWTNPADIWIDS